MTSPVTENVVDQKPNDKEHNFRAIEARLQQERAARLEAEKKADEALRLVQEIKQQKIQDDDDNSNEPYVDDKRLEKKLNKFGQNTQSEIQKAMELAKQNAKQELKQEMWLESNPDFYQVLQLADKFAQKAPKLAEHILKMPDSFERQQLVYQNIKEMGLDKPEQKQPSVQDKIDANRRNPYYQPTGIANSPYASSGDFTQQGQKEAYKKMQELKARLQR